MTLKLSSHAKMKSLKYRSLQKVRNTVKWELRISQYFSIINQNDFVHVTMLYG
jgi:hypothetical protein